MTVAPNGWRSWLSSRKLHQSLIPRTRQRNGYSVIAVKSGMARSLGARIRQNVLGADDRRRDTPPRTPLPFFVNESRGRWVGEGPWVSESKVEILATAATQLEVDESCTQ
jgi:hypothetical protein